MNYLEFKRQLMVDPYSRAEDFLVAKGQDEQFAKAADEAMAFEQLLQEAVNVEVPPGLAEQIILRSTIEESSTAQTPPAATQVPRWRSLWPQALAAGLFAAAVTAGLMTWQDVGQHGAPAAEETLETFVVDHWQHDGPNTLRSAAAQVSSVDELKRVLTAAGVEADEALLSRISFGKNCPTPKGKGAHLVIQTDNGPITLFYAPEARNEAERLTIDDVVAVLISLQNGSAALLGEDEQSVREIGSLVKDNLHPMTTNT